MHGSQLRRQGWWARSYATSAPLTMVSFFWVYNSSSGNFTLSFGGQTTGNLAYNIAASGADSAQTALEGLSTIGSGNVAVTGPATVGLYKVYKVVFQAALATGLTTTLSATNVSLNGSCSAFIGVPIQASTPTYYPYYQLTLTDLKPGEILDVSHNQQVGVDTTNITTQVYSGVGLCDALTDVNTGIIICPNLSHSINQGNHYGHVTRGGMVEIQSAAATKYLTAWHGAVQAGVTAGDMMTLYTNRGPLCVTRWTPPGLK